MDSFEFNKIAAGILISLLIAMSGSLLSEQLVHRQQLAKNAIDIAVVVSGDAGGAAASKELQPIAPLLAKASIEKGKEVAKKCTQCHTFEQGGAAKTGPNLWNIAGGKIAHVADYPYSQGFKDHKGTWTDEDLNKYLHKPRDFIPGTKMSFAGIKDDQERADLIAYLKSLKA